MFDNGNFFAILFFWFSMFFPINIFFNFLFFNNSSTLFNQIFNIQYFFHTFQFISFNFFNHDAYSVDRTKYIACLIHSL